MKKILAAAILVAGLILISAPQAEAEHIYTGIQSPIDYQGKVTLAKYYVDSDSVIDLKNGFSVDIVEELVEYGIRRYTSISWVYLYKNGEWIVASVMSDKLSEVFTNTNTGFQRKFGTGHNAELDSAIWRIITPYAEKIKAKIIQRTQQNTNPQVQFEGDISQLIAEADAKYKAKDYNAARQLLEQAVSANPNDYHAHDLLARSLYREKNKNKDYNRIVDEVQQAVNLAPDNDKKADILIKQIIRV